MTTEIIAIHHDSDVTMARKRAREIALQQGLPHSGAEAVATAVTELGRNIVVHARSGEIAFAPLDENGRRGILVVARDDGPGICDPERAMQDGYTTGKGLGLGLPGTRRLMDDFELTTTEGRGTTVTVKKWVPTLE